MIPFDFDDRRYWSRVTTDESRSARTEATKLSAISFKAALIRCISGPKVLEFRGEFLMLESTHKRKAVTPNAVLGVSNNETEGVVSVFESNMNRLHTTNSWRFLGVDSIPPYNKLHTNIKSDMKHGGGYSGLPASKISELMKSNSLDVIALALSLLIMVNGILDENISRKNGGRMQQNETSNLLDISGRLALNKLFEDGVDVDGYFTSPSERSYDALGLMKQLSKQSASAYANAREVLGDETPDFLLNKRLLQKSESSRQGMTAPKAADGGKLYLYVAETGINRQQEPT
ncbi:Homeodomain-like protein [Artemisia annua]|uniref:Homeodomain-like protein n=1 Tax=Artemisia annua TaxID=35608 RepID=A0A2U1LAB3_ARTAN|nr:Homeodomain-like protein [Artemisia annua]